MRAHARRRELWDGTRSAYNEIPRQCQPQPSRPVYTRQLDRRRWVVRYGALRDEGLRVDDVHGSKVAERLAEAGGGARRDDQGPVRLGVVAGATPGGGAGGGSVRGAGPVLTDGPAA